MSDIKKVFENRNLPIVKIMQDHLNFYKNKTHAIARETFYQALSFDHHLHTLQQNISRDLSDEIIKEFSFYNDGITDLQMKLECYFISPQKLYEMLEKAFNEGLHAYPMHQYYDR